MYAGRPTTRPVSCSTEKSGAAAADLVLNRNVPDPRPSFPLILHPILEEKQVQSAGKNGWEGSVV